MIKGIFAALLLLGLVGMVAVGMGRSTPNTSHAQDDASVACDALVDEALGLVADTCAGIGRNEICYGHDFITAALNDPSLFFSQRGDIVPISAIDTLLTSNVDLDTGTWGVAMANVQADLPDSSEGVTILLFGGAELTPATTELETLPACTFTPSADSDLYAGPGTDYSAVDTAVAGEALTVYSEYSDGAWYRSARGWIAAAGSLACADGVSLLVVDETSASYQAPGQSFALTVDEDANCESVPSGLLIQTPDGQTANLLVNGVELQLGSTAYLRVDNDNDELVIASIEGNVRVTGERVTQELVVGEETGIPLGEGAPRIPNVPRPIGERPQNLRAPLLELLPNPPTLPVPALPRDADGRVVPREGDQLPTNPNGTPPPPITPRAGTASPPPPAGSPPPPDGQNPPPTIGGNPPPSGSPPLPAG